MSATTIVDRFPGRLRTPVPVRPALRDPASSTPSEADYGHGRPGVTFADRHPGTAAGGLLLEAGCCGRHLAIGHATCGEVGDLAEASTPGRVRDVLELWSLLAIRDPDGCGTRVMALGWRVHLMRAWLSPPVVAVDLARGVVTTQAGQGFRLVEPDHVELEPRLRLHLVQELKRRGVAHVRS